ncbi:hypothetical protein DFO62_12621 [Serratia fonticola]|nr:hypothetical protein DFO62_12621 [Serratia fonticola]
MFVETGFCNEENYRAVAPVGQAPPILGLISLALVLLITQPTRAEMKRDVTDYISYYSLDKI